MTRTVWLLVGEKDGGLWCDGNAMDAVCRPFVDGLGVETRLWWWGEGANVTGGSREKSWQWDEGPLALA